MKPEQLYDIIGKIDDTYIEESEYQVEKKKVVPFQRRMTYLAYAVAAILILAIIPMNFLRMGGSSPSKDTEYEMAQDTMQTTEEAAEIANDKSMESADTEDAKAESGMKEAVLDTGEVLRGVPREITVNGREYTISVDYLYDPETYAVTEEAVGEIMGTDEECGYDFYYYKGASSDANRGILLIDDVRYPYEVK